MRKIAVIGIVGNSVFMQVDNFGVTGETTVAKNFHSELGGKGFNQAIAAARFGAEVSFLGAVNKDDVEAFSKATEKYGVKPFLVGKQEKSPYAVIMTDKDGDNRVCVYHGAELSVDDVDFFEEEIKTADALLINNETPIVVNERAVSIAKQNGVRVILNPAPYRENPKTLLDKIDLFTPNELESMGVEGYDNVVITQGAKGCFLKSTNEIVPAIKLKNVVDTTGAGDTFNGVLTVCLAEGKDIISACRTANIASAIKVGRKYVIDGIPTRNEVLNFKENS